MCNVHWDTQQPLAHPRIVPNIMMRCILSSQNFTVGFANVSSLDRVVLNRYSGATHSNHADQRQVVLQCTLAGNNATCGSPTNNYIAPPGVYMLFVLYEGVPSKAKFITVQLSEGTMTDMPATAIAG